MNIEEIPYPEEIFPGAFYTHGGNFGAQGFLLGGEYEEIMRDAGVYIDQYITKNMDIPFDIDKYNFSIFRANDNSSLKTMHQGYIRFLSETINDILELPVETQVSDLNSNAKKRIDHKLGKLGTEIYPDTDYMVSLNYEDFPVGFLGFDITAEGEILITQIQSGNIVDETRTFYGEKHHFLDGFDWAKVLVSFFEDYLQKGGFSGKMIIQSAENNAYYKKKGKLEVFEKRYNTTASELGYDRSYKNWKVPDIALDFVKQI